MSNWDGIYAAYVTGTEGQGFVMLVFLDGLISGCDVAGANFDGSYSVTENGLTGNIRVSLPPEVTVVQGVSTGPSGITYELPIAIEDSVLDGPFFAIETPLGKVNVRLERLRTLGVGE